MDDIRGWVEAVLYGSGASRRFTQDSPVLPDVWAAYFEDPQARIDLLIEPWNDKLPNYVASQLLTRLEGPPDDLKQKLRTQTGTTFNRTTVVSRLCLSDLIKHIIPMSGWYLDVHKEEGLRRKPSQGPRMSSPFGFSLPEAAILWDDVKPLDRIGYRYPRVLSLVRISGLIAYMGINGRTDRLEELLSALRSIDEETAKSARGHLAALMIAGYQETIGNTLPPPEESLVYTVNRNRPAFLALHHSVKTVKADAADHVFNISCKRIVWAVIDSGIDATHSAFLAMPTSGELPTEVEDRLQLSRVKATYDFSQIRELLLGEDLDRLHEPYRKGLSEADGGRDQLSEMVERVRRGRAIDWEILKPFLQVPHTKNDYIFPVDGHGTHVAGILGADWDRGPDRMRGMCPDIRMIDIRITRQDGASDEFVLISALQFLRYLNAHADIVAVHGANMSLSLEHDAANYACGQTPICEEAERTVASGVAVVAAAGNRGYRRRTADGTASFDQFCPVSITDPGNAEAVITVGATHRIRPHTYGVSYFSSRGPTGDGRIKPDLVAPGEKIFAPALRESALRLDGTSMAAPHVSGAAAMLMARHVELIGNPARVKDILCRTATDLGRERYFQGHGLVDVLRAIQSV